MPAEGTLGGFLITYGLALAGGLRRVLGNDAPRVLTPLPRHAGPPPTVLPDPKPAPAKPQPAPAVSVYETRRIDEPKRQSGRKAKRASKARIALRHFQVWYDDLPGPVRDGIEYAGNNPAGAPGVAGPRVKLPPLPGTGSRSSQRGFIMGTGPRTVSKAPGHSEPDYWNPNAPGARLPVNRPPPRAAPPQAAPQPARPMAVPKLYEPVPTAPEVLTQPQPQRAAPGGKPDTSRTAPGDATKPVHPGLGSTTATPSTHRLPAAAGPPTARPGKTGTGTRVARATTAAPFLSFGALFANPFGKPSRGPANALSRTRAVGPTTAPATAPARQPTLTQFLPGAVTSRSATARDRNRDCKCPETDKKKKKSKPREPRTECWTGTYTETAKSSKKTRLQQVPCT